LGHRPEPSDDSEVGAAGAAWREYSRQLNYELFDQAVGAFDWSCIEELRKSVAATEAM
jgi:hypothetical protein